MEDKEIKYKQDYDIFDTLITRNKQIYLKVKQNVPRNFETLLDYVKNKQSKFVIILDGITIALRIDKRKSLLIHKTLLDSHVDISIVNGSYRMQNFMTLPINIVFFIICQYN